MLYSFWYNRCCIDPVTAVAVSENSPPEYADLVRYVWPYRTISGRRTEEGGPGARCLRYLGCGCHVCGGHTNAVVINAAPANVETALNMNPMMMQIARLNKVPKTFDVSYAFVMPSVFDSGAFEAIAERVDMTCMYVSTTLDITDGEEDTSLFKLTVLQRRTPYSGSRDHIEWLRDRIADVVHCEPLYYATTYVSTFAPLSYTPSRHWTG